MRSTLQYIRWHERPHERVGANKAVQLAIGEPAAFWVPCGPGRQRHDAAHDQDENLPVRREIDCAEIQGYQAKTKRLRLESRHHQEHSQRGERQQMSDRHAAAEPEKVDAYCCRRCCEQRDAGPTSAGHRRRGCHEKRE